MILVLGSTGFLGKRVCKKLDKAGAAYRTTSLSQGCDLRDPVQVDRVFSDLRPDHLLNCAAYVGGIQFGYKHPAELFRNNLLMTINILDAAARYKVKRIVNPISNCAYPAKATLFKENEFWDGPLHESVMVYGFSRKASWIGSWAYAKQYGLDQVNIILSNMFGPEDHFEEERSHAMGALIMKLVEAKLRDAPSVTIWGTGKPVREWLYVDDGAEAMIRAMSIASYADPINVGIARGISVIEMAEMIKRIVGYEGELKLDLSKPDGALYKTVDGTTGARVLGWSPSTNFEEAVRATVEWYQSNRKGRL
jgi:GDP-L-fucose synthase